MIRPIPHKATGIALVALGFAIAASVLVPYAGELAESDYSEFVTEAAGAATAEDPFPAIDWESLLAANPDVVGWVRVVGTPIDYPIVQARRDDPQRYLSCALDGSWNGHGCPYVDADCDGTRGRCVLTYGHNMIDGSMYSAFAGFADQDYLDGHREILLMTPAHNFRLEAVAASEVSAWEHHPQVAFTNAKELSAYLAAEASHAQAVGRVPSSCAQLFEFVCCSYGTSNGRTVVYAVEPDSRGTVYVPLEPAED